MSIFDKFTQKNQYVKTYAGAPIQEAMAVTSQLNQRAASNIASMDKTQATVNAAPAIGEADKAYKNLVAQQVQEDLTGIMEAPEHATMKVRQAAQKYNNDPGLRLAAANAAKHAKFYEQYEKDPSKYGDIPTWKLNKAMQQYEADGGAAGGAVLKTPALYEQIDDNEWMRANGEDIAASTKGVSWNGKDGFIYENTKEQLSKAEVANILGGAVYGSKDLMRQYRDEHAMAKEMGYEGNLDNFVAAKIDPYSSMFSYEKNITKMKGDGQGSGKKSGKYDYNPNAMTYGGKSVPVTIQAKTESGIDLLNQLQDMKSSDTKEGQDAYQKLRAGYDRAIDAVGAAENLDPMAVEFMKTMTPMMFDGVRSKNRDVGTGDVVEGTTMNATGEGTVFNNSRTNIKSGLMEKYGSNITPEQAEKYAKQIDRAMTSSWWQTDVEDVFAEANTLNVDTEMVIVSDALGMTATQEKRNNQAMAGNLSAIDEVTYFGEDGAEVMTGEDLREKYVTGEAKIHSMDKNGTGVTVVSMENKETGETEQVYLKLDPERNSVFTSMAQMYTDQANDQNLPMNQRLNATAAALNVMHPTISASAELVQKSGTRAPLNFGGLTTPIAQRFGPIFMDRDENGDYHITDNNNTNLFENSPEFTSMLADADNHHAVAALVVNYCRQKLTVR